MSRKSSIPQDAKSVSVALMPDSRAGGSGAPRQRAILTKVLAAFQICERPTPSRPNHSKGSDLNSGGPLLTQDHQLITGGVGGAMIWASRAVLRRLALALLCRCRSFGGKGGAHVQSLVLGDDRS